MNPNQAFEDAYQRLNAEQQKAVDAIEGPVFVIAGPGTGKTQVLTLRIANILKKTDTPPESILALTFTEAAAREMRERLRSIIGSRATKVRIHTFHGFAESLIGQYPDQFPRIIGSHIATDAERAELMDKALLETPVKRLRPFGDPLFYHGPTTRAISTMKRENITPDALEERVWKEKEDFENSEGKVHEKGQHKGKMKSDFVDRLKRIEKTEDLLAVYRAYEDALTAARRYDFDDLILEVLKALTEDEQFRLQVQESILYILADEHQDANGAQNALLELVSGFHERPNLFIVGDEKQAIFRFQGADLDNVHYFKDKFPGTAVLALVENYRSTQSILDSALALISASQDKQLSRVKLIANSDTEPKPLTLTICQSVDQELMQLAANIAQLIETGTRPGDIAVLVRRNSEVTETARALMRAGLPVTHAGNDDALKNRFVLALMRLLRVAAEPRDEYLAGVLTNITPVKDAPLSAADCARITLYARKEKQPILSVLSDKSLLAAAKVSNIEAAQQLGALIEKLARAAAVERPAEVATKALQESGLVRRALAAPDRSESLAAIRGLLRAFEELSMREHDALLPRALQMLDLYAERGIALPGRDGEDETRVKVMTVHKSKGREFEYVFLPFLTSSSWSTRNRGEYFELPDVLSGANGLEDERRLLYVAITRAKQHATLSYALTNAEGRNFEPSELIEDLEPKLIETVPPTVSDEAWLSALEQKREGGQPSEDDLATLRAAFFSQGLSPTALNNYLACPWKYFYVNLLRIPEVENKFMLFGTAMHAALKRYADERAKGTDMTAEELVSVFLNSLDRMPLSAREVDEMREKGKRALPIWREARHAEWPAESRAEVPVVAELPLEESAGDVLTIRGALDRIDDLGGSVRVIDYKTGKSKSRAEIMGQTKDADGNYYRQLTFYKLLLARTEEQPRTMHAGVIEFIEPDEKDRIKSETFEIMDSEVAELEGLIRKSAEEILTLSFWNRTCAAEDCEWCSIRFAERGV